MSDYNVLIIMLFFTVIFFDHMVASVCRNVCAWYCYVSSYNFYANVAKRVNNWGNKLREIHNSINLAGNFPVKSAPSLLNQALKTGYDARSGAGELVPLLRGAFFIFLLPLLVFLFLCYLLLWLLLWLLYFY